MASRLSRKKFKATDASESTTKTSRHKSEQTTGVSNATASSTGERTKSTSNELDMSSADFSGGCSPFQYTAARALLKGQQNKRTRKKKDEGNTRNKSIDIKPSRSNIESQDSDGSMDSLHTDKNDKITNKMDKDVTEKQEVSLAKENIESPEGKKCTTCSKVVPTAEFPSHTVQCLRQNFERKKTGSKDGVILFCQICQEELSGLSDVDRQQHYNRCLDSGPDPQPAKYCHVCNKNLAHLNQTRKTQHINKCMDQAEALRKHEEAREKAMEKARNKVLDCPLCGKPLKTNNSRQSHVKKCGRELGVPSDQVLARLHQQQEEHARLLSAGILPPEQNRRGRPPKRPTPGSSTSGAATTTTQGNVNRMDDDTALAIALSTSLKEEELRRKRTSLDDFNLPGVVPDHVRMTMASEGGLIEGRGDGLSQDGLKDAFSVLMSPTPVEKVKKRKKKKEKRPVPVLLVQTALEAQEKLAQRFADLILPPPTAPNKEAETPKFKVSAVREKYNLENLSPTKLCPIWKKTALLPEEDGNFYVTSLTPHVQQCTLHTGSKIKKMSLIPGWKPLEASPEKPKTANQTMLVSTQTAVLLAELADGNVTSMLDQTKLLNQTGWLNQTCRREGLDQTMDRNKTIGQKGEGRKESGYEDQPSGFFEELSQSQSATASAQNTLLVGLQQDLSGMVDNSLASDVSIHTQGASIPAHSFILAARAPLLYKAVTDSRIDLGTYSRSSVLALLRYLYVADVTNVQSSVLTELQELANRFHLKELAAQCSKMAGDLGDDLDNDLQDDLDRSSHSKVNDTLQNLLKEMWGSDEDNSQEEEEEEKEEEGLDDLYFMASQRAKESPESEEDCKDEDNDSDVEEDTEANEDIDNDNFDKSESPEKFHNSRLSSGAIEDLMKEWDSSDSDEKSVISRNDINETGDSKPTNKQTNDNQNQAEHSAEPNQERQSQTPTRTASRKNSPSPVLIQSESENELDNSGSDLFDSLTPVKSDCDKDRNSPAIPNTEDRGSDVFIAESQFNDSSCSPVFTTQKCRGTQNVEAKNVSINLVDSDGDLAELNLENTKVAKKRKHSSSKTDSTSVLTPKRPRQDSVTPRKESGTPKRAGFPGRSRDKVITPSRQGEAIQIRQSQKKETPGRVSQKNEPSGRVSQKNEPSGRVNQKNESPGRVSQKKETPGRVSQKNEPSGRVNQKNEPPGRVSQNNEPPGRVSQKNESPGRVSQNITHKRARQEEMNPKVTDLSPKRSKQKKCPKRSLEQDFLKANLSQDLDASPVFPKSSTLQTSKQSSTGGNEALVDLTQDEDYPENGAEECENEKMENRSSGSSYQPSQNLDGFCDVFEGYEEPEAYQEDMMMEVEPPMDQPQPTSTMSSGDEELPDLRTVSKINLAEASTQQSTTNSDKLESTAMVNNEGKDLGQIGKVAEQKWEENVTAIDGREEDGTATQKSRKLKKFHFKSQRCSQSQKSVGNTSKESDHANTTERSFASKNKDTHFTNSQQASSTNLISQDSKDKPSTEAEAGLDVTFGSDDDGVLNMVMDEVEGVEEFDPPTDISMNVSAMESSFREPRVHPNLLKTPVAPAVAGKKPLSDWQAPSPFTPMPQYDSMKTPDLKKHCTKYGIRALPKKKMVGLLKDVYARTHQYETDSEYEQPSPSSSKTDQSHATSQPTNQQAAKKTKAGKSKAGKEAGKKRESKKKQPTEETSDDTGLNESFEEKSSGTDLPEESIIISPTSSPVSKKDIAYKRQQVMDYIQTHEEVYLKILHYEPLEFDEFHQELKAGGVSLGKQLLMDLLDDKCVQFSLRGSRKPQKSRRRSPKKRGSPSKTRGRGRGRGGRVQNSQSTQS